MCVIFTHITMLFPPTRLRTPSTESPWSLKALASPSSSATYPLLAWRWLFHSKSRIAVCVKLLLGATRLHEGKCSEEGGSEERAPTPSLQRGEVLWGESKADHVTILMFSIYNTACLGLWCFWRRQRRRWAWGVPWNPKETPKGETFSIMCKLDSIFANSAYMQTQLC